MKVQNLIIERKPSYDDDYPNQMVGLVQIMGEHGKMEARLSNKAVSEIFKLIKDDVQRTVDYNAGQASHAIEQAENEQLLIEAQ